MHIRNHSTLHGNRTGGILADIPGTGPFARELREIVQAVAGTGEHLIISGEPGTGKRFIASAINTLALHRAGGNLIEITPQTHEDEVRAILFEEDRRRIEGMLGRSVGVLGPQGTLVIRNVYEFSIIGQTRVARFLIQQESPPAAAATQLRVIFLVPPGWVPKTRQRPVIDSLDQYLRSFRQIVMKPLRFRPEDIPSFVEYFLHVLLPPGSNPLAVDEATMAQLTKHPWHDNVRELKLVVEDGVSRSGNGVFALPDSFVDEVALVEGILGNILSGKKGSLDVVLSELERALIRRALVRADHDRVRSAQLLGVTDLNLRYRLRKFQLHSPSNPQREDPGGRAEE